MQLAGAGQGPGAPRCRVRGRTCRCSSPRFQDPRGHLASGPPTRSDGNLQTPVSWGFFEHSKVGGRFRGVNSRVPSKRREGPVPARIPAPSEPVSSRRGRAGYIFDEVPIGARTCRMVMRSCARGAPGLPESRRPVSGTAVRAFLRDRQDRPLPFPNSGMARRPTARRVTARAPARAIPPAPRSGRGRAAATGSSSRPRRPPPCGCRRGPGSPWPSRRR